MKKLACEMCGGMEMVKQDGVYVCQYCGMKYSVEEAKKLMIEGTVDVQGTVKVDNSAFVEKYLANARRAKQKEDWEETEKYYNMVEQNDPTNIEAIFYSAYGKAKMSLIDSDIYKRQSAFKVLNNCVSIIDDNFSMENREENEKIIMQISHDVMVMVCSEFVYNTRKNGYGNVVSSDRSETTTLFNRLQLEFCNSMVNIISKYPQELEKNTLMYIKIMLEHYEHMLKHGNLAKPEVATDMIDKLHHRWNKIDPMHVIPEKQETGSWGLPIAAIILAGCIPIVGIILGIKTISNSENHTAPAYKTLGVLAVVLGIVSSIWFLFAFLLPIIL